jgi:hypothetical protein
MPGPGIETRHAGDIPELPGPGLHGVRGADGGRWRGAHPPRDPGRPPPGGGHGSGTRRQVPRTPHFFTFNSGPCEIFVGIKFPLVVICCVADPGCLSRIRIFSIPDPGSKRFRIPDPHQRI